ncbi:hypothetical protein Celaphus_00001802 [Cervus elaphus hippelaphus]|uniref:Uncharacterized protein n=1 Tax=Cervus elaphus hippelaphus TaxID=46360 RepID=A0A212CH51_CEREH|nr:hypothetical protein Celaphus_00001802 [Cervus elaphus hippelaphus]
MKKWTVIPAILKELGSTTHTTQLSAVEQEHSCLSDLPAGAVTTMPGAESAQPEKSQSCCLCKVLTGVKC